MNNTIKVILMLTACMSILQAHRVNIFVKTDRGKVICQCYYNDGKPVKGQPVQVTTPDGAVIAQGSTDEEGIYTFSPTVRETLTIAINAGMGHAATTTIQKDLLPVLPEKTKPAKSSSPAPAAVKNRPDEEILPMDEQQVRDIIEQALDERLNPLIELIVKQQRSQSLTAVIGGIGYILGIFGLLMLLRSRRKQ